MHLVNNFWQVDEWLPALVDLANAEPKREVAAARRYAKLIDAPRPTAREAAAARRLASRWLGALGRKLSPKKWADLADELGSTLDDLSASMSFKLSDGTLPDMFKAQIGKKTELAYKRKEKPEGRARVRLDIRIERLHATPTQWVALGVASLLADESGAWDRVATCKGCGRLFVRERRHGGKTGYCVGHSPTPAERMAKSRAERALRSRRRKAASA